uniref:Uncharacterized protein n=1 Tax=Haptolina ericina TaxID=156174 RepID=A0A7S3ANM9_9EUKA|mmetsp:Transcript_25277/g.57589  ORF Transcript_25277/g.57589 Transcript_25277/m.57589 type:complete len:346 (+) Transcript_25277:192-1229(+)
MAPCNEIAARNRVAMGSPTLGLLLLLCLSAPVQGSTTTSHGSTNHGRVAVCVTGQLRTLMMSPNSSRYPQRWGETGMRFAGRGGSHVDPRLKVGVVADSIHHRLFDVLERHGFDVYMVVSTKGKSDRTPAVGDTSACEPLRPNSTGNELFCEVPYDAADSPPATPAFEHKWSAYRYPDAAGISSMLAQMRDQSVCMKMIRRSGRAYSHMIRTRPDVGMLTRFPALHTLFGDPQASRNVYIANMHACCCGNEDWFGIGTFDVMQWYFSRYDAAQRDASVLPYKERSDRSSKDMLRPENETWTSEDFLASYLNQTSGAQLVQSQNIRACVVKPADRHMSERRHWGQP